ncbi:Heptaprenyl diphosphate synthase component 2 [compost metagenome]
MGIAFQIKDDTFDFGTDDVGKPLGIDIKEKKVTLPLIYALNAAGKAERKRMIDLVKNHQDDSRKIQEVIDFVNEKQGVQHAQQKMLEYQQEAFDILYQFEDSDARNGLEQLVRYTTERKK